MRVVAELKRSTRGRDIARPDPKQEPEALLAAFSLAGLVLLVITSLVFKLFVG
jgi:hypothetical protein